MTLFLSPPTRCWLNMSGLTPPETAVPRPELFLSPRPPASRASPSGTSMEALLDKPLETIRRSFSDLAEFSRTLSVPEVMVLTTFWSCAIPGLLPESHFRLMLVLLLKRHSPEKKTKKFGSDWNKNLPSSTLMSALLSVGPKVACPAAPKVHITALLDPRTVSGVISLTHTTRPVCMLESRFREPTVKSCLDSKNTRLDHVSESMLVTNS
mmetsp:Transcript_35560/g.101248  ORF Transcript_35560/g.101248 Transcript_35560/m.101248 type:complete len:210 (-) Transcript_35560:537-1166(-)